MERLRRPEQNDDTYYPFSIKENMEWFIADLEAYCDFLEKEKKEQQNPTIRQEVRDKLIEELVKKTDNGKKRPSTYAWRDTRCEIKDPDVMIFFYEQYCTFLENKNKELREEE
jgi:hypothetical protein